MMRALLIMSLLQVFSFAVATLVPSTTETDNFNLTEDQNGCLTVIHTFDERIHKPKYRVGVYASEGEQVVFDMYNNVFAKYLTATAGKRFNPPLEFEVVAVSLTNALDMAEDETMDFIFASSAVFSCMATERKAQALVTIINRRESRGYEYDLDKYGGVMFTLNDANNGIDSIQDFRGRTIGAGAITAMGAGQTQFYEMTKRGVSYVADPKQVIFTKDERQVVQGVLDKEFEIGFARTDQIERHTNDNGEPLREGTFKIINPQTHVLDDGKIFPFVSSTGLHPEWPVGAMDHVDRGVSQEVQEALLAVQAHALAADMGENVRCETTAELAKLAADAMSDGAFSGFRTPRSYFEVRTKQEKAGFVKEDPESGLLHCIRGDTLYHDLQCPTGQYKVTEEEFDMSCDAVGLECKESYECYCQPCIKAFEVDVFQYFDGSDDSVNQTNTKQKQEGCEKMSVCGTTYQTKEITFRAVDNVERDDAYVRVILHNDQEEDIPLKVWVVEDAPYTYEFSWSQDTVGVGIIEIFFDNKQIPESPMRLQVQSRLCDADYHGRGMVATENGLCVCSSDTVEIGGTCVENTYLAIAGSIFGVICLAFLGSFWVAHKNRKNDQMWQVELDELHFDDPVEIIGQGSFGVVLLAEYRGTKVAIKRAVKGKKNSGSRSGGAGSTIGGSGGRARPTDANSVVMTSTCTLGSDDSDDDELSTPNAADVEAPLSSSAQAAAANGSRSTTQYSQHFSLGFLQADFGGRSRWARFFPWLEQKNDYQSRFHASVLGTASQSSHGNGAILFPCFNKRAREREEFQSEMRILARLRHPCITTVMGAVVTKTHDPMLVMEYMEYGSLHDILRNETMYLSGEIILQIARDLAQGLRYLHTSKPPILHGDLKSRNILLDSRFRAKLCDFGLSTKTGDSISGTPFWLAPEYLRGEKKYDTTCDIYSVGILLFEIFSRQSPYHGEDFREVMRGVCNRRVNKRPKVPARTPAKFEELMKKCWSPDPNYRPQARDLDMGFLDMCEDDAEPLTEDQQYGKIKNRSADMIYELFPRHVADLIKKGQKVEPESHDLVTVIFSDIIHFTDISQTISPEKVCDMLDRLYVAFDGIARKHQIFKVETIGDAYMGVTNLEKNQEKTQVKHIAEFAIEMINEARNVMIDKDDPSRGYINIRVGFHSGPVVSNVIGTLNKRFGLFGDTVNTASRMESNATANRILCSERSYNLLREQAPHIKTKKRGKISVKGKGDMNVYWVGDNMLKTTTTKKERAEKNEKAVGFAEDYSQGAHSHSSRRHESLPDLPELADAPAGSFDLLDDNGGAEPVSVQQAIIEDDWVPEEQERAPEAPPVVKAPAPATSSLQKALGMKSSERTKTPTLPPFSLA